MLLRKHFKIYDLQIAGNALKLLITTLFCIILNLLQSHQADHFCSPGYGPAIFGSEKTVPQCLIKSSPGLHNC